MYAAHTCSSISVISPNVSFQMIFLMSTRSLFWTVVLCISIIYAVDPDPPEIPPTTDTVTTSSTDTVTTVTVTTVTTTTVHTTPNSSASSTVHTTPNSSTPSGKYLIVNINSRIHF